MLARESYVHLIRQLNDLIAIFERHPDPVTQEQVTALLSGLDALHREGLQRLVDGLRDVGGDALLERITDDPVVEILLGLYDLAELDLPDVPQEQPASTATFIPFSSIGIRGRSPSDGEDR